MRKALFLITAVTLACGAASAPPASTNTATTAPAATTAPTASVPQTSPARTAAATPSRNPGSAEVTLRWEAGTNVGDIDDVTDIINHLKEKPGIEGGYGDELQIVIAYDAQKINVEQIRRLLSDMGFPTKAPGS